jgi:hypothetical protein
MLINRFCFQFYLIKLKWAFKKYKGILMGVVLSRNFFLSGVALSAVLLLSSCSTTSNPDMRYLSYRSTAAIKVPAGAKAPAQRALYPLPKMKVAKAKPMSLIPPGSSIAQLRAEQNKKN